VLFAYAVCAQQHSTVPSFEVASVKVAPPFTPGVERGCSKADPAVFRCNGTPLKMLLMLAYGLSWAQHREYQLQGPGWLDTEAYDVAAKMPAGESTARIPAMLQTLLAERFQIKLHKESRMMPAYELNVAKGGAKLQPVDASKLPAKGRPGAAGVLAMSGKAGGIQVAKGNVTMEDLTNYLAGQFERPVLDNTGLKGTYAIDLSYVTEEKSGPDGGAAMPVGTLPQVLQDLGLKLDSKKTPVEVTVIDSANKIPTKN